MQMYKYIRRTKKGIMKRGTIESTSRNQEIVALREIGISTREVIETKATIFNKNLSFGLGNVKHQHFVIYCRQFATLIRAGISIVDATNILAEQTESKGLKKVLKEVQSEIREGRSFSDAIREHSKVFPPIFINMIRAGDMTGNLDETLDRLATYFEKQYNLKKKVQSTLAYPVILVFVIVAVVIFLMVSIVPNFTSMFEQFGSELPLITQWVVKISDFIRYSWWI